MSLTDTACILRQAWITLLIFASCVPALAAGNSFHTLRIMPENDIVGAYTEAQRLRSALDDTATETDRVHLLNLLARIEFLLGSSEQAEIHNRQAMDLATQIADRAGQSEALLNLTKIALNQGKIEQSIEFAFRSYHLLEEDTEHPELLGEVMFWLTSAYRRRKLESPFSLNIGLLSFARMLSKQGRQAERVELLNDVISIYEKHPNPGLWYALAARSEGYQQ
ncbi:hypothetical protein [Microbulbifer rhizosphaerae]|uniref:Tetratricopeptide (TPR) repeat protein n=1 Tax=Microbulbifer rhizosphaerae TaxID=1562603 RepID=A0A7W4WES4_9GAMM|nr:hypothetical protein [Microbulbifer rhizosphaerae]MBB3062407.1 tetratricopeptide (TPR) repeat protein [Microbulbifer rhizosphaerae]